MCMAVLMLSIDRKILNPESRVARRMIRYSQEEDLHILIPHNHKRSFSLAQRVQVQSTGGFKLIQFLRLITEGLAITKKRPEISRITVQDPFFLGLAGFILKKRSGLSLEVQLHGDFFGSPYFRSSSVMNRLQYHIGKWVLGRADTVRVVGERIREHVIAMGFSSERILVRSVAQEDTSPRADYNDIHIKYPSNTPIYAMIGRIEKVKNIEWMIDVFRKILDKKPSALFLIVGEGSQKGSIAKKIRNENLEKNVIMESWVEDPQDYLATVDCVLFPSLSEGYGLVPMEAHSLGTRVIMNDVGVARYEFPAGPLVDIIPIEDQDKWVEAMLQV